jgi:hypothetical protein
MNIFSGKRYFNDIFWEPAYNKNTLPDADISSNKIEKYKAHRYGKGNGCMPERRHCLRSKTAVLLKRD